MATVVEFALVMAGVSSIFRVKDRLAVPDVLTAPPVRSPCVTLAGRVPGGPVIGLLFRGGCATFHVWPVQTRASCSLA